MLSCSINRYNLSAKDLQCRQIYSQVSAVLAKQRALFISING
jgi:antitoxin component HigA of HigAB toxin-antitoxin module